MYYKEGGLSNADLFYVAGRLNPLRAKRVVSMAEIDHYEFAGMGSPWESIKKGGSYGWSCFNALFVNLVI